MDPRRTEPLRAGGALVGIVLAIALRGERASLASLGVRPPGLGSVAWGIAAAAGLVYALVPLASGVVAALGFGAGLDTVLA